MPRSPIYIDITELVKNPICTGIQRVEREILQNWSAANPLVPCVYDKEKEQFTEISSAFLGYILNNNRQDKDQRLPKKHYRTIPLDQTLSNLFNPEVFFDPQRAQKYIDFACVSEAKISWLVYDFMPFLYPRHYPAGTSLHCMPYLLAMRNIPKLAFISKQTEYEFETKIMRGVNRETVVLPLGGDGLKLERQRFSSERKHFVYFGTIEPRKNVGIILQAFARLWEQNQDIELYIVGRMDSRAQFEAKLIEDMRDERRFHYLGHASDEVMCDVLRRARATIYVSSEEGFGIPPIESLAAGIPVIASSTLPSLNDLPKRGYLTIETISIDAMCAAVETLMVDANASKLWEEAANLSIPTWRNFVTNLSNWLQA